MVVNHAHNRTGTTLADACKSGSGDGYDRCDVHGISSLRMSTPCQNMYHVLCVHAAKSRATPLGFMSNQDIPHSACQQKTPRTELHFARLVFIIAYY
jgi:hypothetical protein